MPAVRQCCEAGRRADLPSEFAGLYHCFPKKICFRNWTERQQDWFNQPRPHPRPRPQLQRRPRLQRQFTALQASYIVQLFREQNGWDDELYREFRQIVEFNAQIFLD